MIGDGKEWVTLERQTIRLITRLWIPERSSRRDRDESVQGGLHACNDMDEKV